MLGVISFDVSFLHLVDAGIIIFMDCCRCIIDKR